MRAAFDIETIGNPDVLELLPEPEVKLGNTKDPVKIEEKKKAAKVSLLEKMALDASTGRIICAAFCNDDQNKVEIVNNLTDLEEIRVISTIFKFLGMEDMQIETWNGNGFDLPFVYKRAMILGMDSSVVPPLSYWTRRYRTEPHADLMQVWGGWSGMASFTKLDTVAALVLGRRKQEIDFKDFPTLLQSEGGRQRIAEYCLTDTQITNELASKFKGWLY